LDSEILSDHPYEVFRRDRKLRKAGWCVVLLRMSKKWKEMRATSNRPRRNLLNGKIPFIVPLVSD
ncbi:hypothetical protein V3C99_001183, partial [Haemonchus contortus]